MSEFISLTEAHKMIKTYKDTKPLILREGQSSDVLPLCETFTADHVRSLLEQTGCGGLRVYFGMDDSKNVKLVLVGVDDNDKDICEGTNAFLDKGARCPSNCPPDSPLNS